MLDENTARLNEYEVNQYHADKRAELLGRDQATITDQIELVEVCTARLVYRGVETQVGIRKARHSDILGECLEDGRLRKAMQEWRETSNTHLVDNVIWRAAARCVAETLGFSIKELGLVATTYPNMNESEKGGYEFPLSAHIDSLIIRDQKTFDVAPVLSSIHAIINGEKQLVTGRGKTKAEASANAIKLTNRLIKASKMEVAA